jgi:predicted dehydrogenase
LDRKIRWGVIGSGGIAQRRTIPEGIIAAEHAELAGVYDINRETNEAVARKFHTFAWNSAEELLNSDIDAVYIATPANRHYGQVISCADRGKHVFCEKPLGLTTGEAESMIEICHDQNVLLGVGLMMRFSAQHREALRIIREGLLGNPVYARAQLSCWYPPVDGAWRQNPDLGGGGSLIDMGSHCIDLLEMFFGKVKSVHCFTNNIIHPYRSEDAATVSLCFENGALASVDSFFCIPDNSSKNMLELYGSKGSILAKGTIGQGDSGEMTAFLENDDREYEAIQHRQQGSGFLINPAPVNTYCAEIEDFSLAVIQGREPLNNGLAGLRNQRILEACYLSARSGKTVSV